MINICRRVSSSLIQLNPPKKSHVEQFTGRASIMSLKMEQQDNRLVLGRLQSDVALALCLNWMNDLGLDVLKTCGTLLSAKMSSIHNTLDLLTQSACVKL